MRKSIQVAIGIGFLAAMAFVGGYMGAAHAGQMNPDRVYQDDNDDQPRARAGYQMNCVSGVMQRSCSLTPIYEGLKMTAEDIRMRNERIAKWETYCKPVVKQDALGVGRASYAHVGCDVGRMED